MKIMTIKRSLAVLSLVTVCLSSGCMGTRNTGRAPGGENVAGGGHGDGKDLYSIELRIEDDREILTIHINDGKWDRTDPPVPARTVPFFTIDYEEYPARIVGVFNGIRLRSATMPDCTESRLIKQMKHLMYLDDQAVAFETTFNRCVWFTVTELSEPARVVIEIGEAEGCGSESVWSLRSEEALRGEMVGHFQERLMHLEGAGQVRELTAENGQAIVEEGKYATRAEAEARREVLLGMGIELIVEERTMFEWPAIGKE